MPTYPHLGFVIVLGAGVIAFIVAQPATDTECDALTLRVANAVRQRPALFDVAQGRVGGAGAQLPRQRPE